MTEVFLMSVNPLMENYLPLFKLNFLTILAECTGNLPRP